MLAFSAHQVLLLASSYALPLTAPQPLHCNFVGKRATRYDAPQDLCGPDATPHAAKPPPRGPSCNHKWFNRSARPPPAAPPRNGSSGVGGRKRAWPGHHRRQTCVLGGAIGAPTGQWKARANGGNCVSAPMTRNLPELPPPHPTHAPIHSQIAASAC